MEMDGIRLGRGGIDRRTFVRASGAGAAALVFGVGPFVEKAVARPAFRDYPFRLGVASGDPSPDGFVIWTRLAPEPLAGDGRGGMPPDRKVLVRWEVSEEEGFGRGVVRRGRVEARPELGHSVHVEVGGLRAGRWYWYRFEAGGEVSPVGRARTLPSFGRDAGRMSFAFASCQQYEHGYYNAYRRMAEEDLDLVLHLGDYIYEYGPNEYRAPGGNVRLHDGPETVTLAAYRNRHALYRSDRDLQAAHAAFPWLVTWDDHEVENNYAGEIPEQGQSPEAFLRRRAAAYQAYYEHMPLRRSSVPRGPDMRLYRRLTWGNLVEFNLLDTRQYRDDQAYGDGIKPPGEESRSPDRTMTGREQERWLFDGLAGSYARWNVLAQQVFFSRRDFDTTGGVTYSMDAWDGYEAQRDRIVDFMARSGVHNPVVITGDVHNNWVSEILRDFDDPGSEVVGVEFVGTSISSGGDGADTSAEQQAILAGNPHIKFFNGQRGYVRCTVTPERWRTDYRIVPYVSQPGARVYTRASFVVEAGRPGLRQAAANAVPSRDPAFIEPDRARIREQRLAGR
ncbi:alkaline phosphatase D [Rubrobacter xylanophilus]|uniref:Alkaline phosphatase D n=1 Tax=Rubrobacter xylanophilus TaxID=49319 RepID=A0A510HKD1_9ACTN|nr:alkaline phosphatase D family protein [Rubrobacter xylanophilus]BBL80338.1 alkaline phosphatase D [Rubrobacter xylanophilus]